MHQIDHMHATKVISMYLAAASKWGRVWRSTYWIEDGRSWG
jgi:hypothetical protein